LGIRNANENASQMGPSPKSFAEAISRNIPSTRLASVDKATIRSPENNPIERICGRAFSPPLSKGGQGGSDGVVIVLCLRVHSKWVGWVEFLRGPPVWRVAVGLVKTRPTLLPGDQRGDSA